VRELDNARLQPRGFTLLELMIVVAIVGVLAAVVIPNWASTSRNKKYDPEITAMTTEISNREEQYKSEVGNGVYLGAATCPASPSQNGIDFNASCVTGATAWVTLRVNPTDTSIRCTYAITVGAAGSQPASPPSACPTAPTLAGAWYYILATCDMDGKGGTNATFCLGSWNSKYGQANYGS
jgi:prepilin-type N-terminal cleavage/methylation domain-containing protein